MTAKNILKNWFSTGKRPTGAQFAEWLDSYWHKSDTISNDVVEGFNDKANKITQSYITYQIDAVTGVDYPSDIPVQLGMQLTAWYDIQAFIVEVTGVDENDIPTDFYIVQAGISSYPVSTAYFYDSGESVYMECSVSTSEINNTDYRDLSDVQQELTELDSYTRNNFYTKNQSDSRFLPKNTSPVITLYAGTNQLQTRINEVQKFLTVANNSSSYYVDIHVQGNQTAANIYVQGFSGGGRMRIIFDGAFSITNRLYVNDNSIEVEVNSASTAAMGTVSRLTFVRCLGGVRAINVNILDSYQDAHVVLFNDTRINGFAEINPDARLSIRGNNVTLFNLISTGITNIYNTIIDLNITLYPNFVNPLIFDNRPGNPLDTFVRRGNFPDPPASGNYTLKSIDGVMQWVES